MAKHIGARFLDQQAFADAYATLQGDDAAIRANLVLAMGSAAGAGLAGCHAAIAIVHQWLWPEHPLPDAARTLLGWPD